MNQKLRMYSASVSHEMLNPIACVINFVTQLLDLEQSHEKREFLGMIFISAKMLQCHTQDLLDQDMI